MAEEIFLTTPTHNSGLRIEFQPLPHSLEHPAGTAWGCLRLWLDNQLIWSQTTEDGAEHPVEWSWVDLLDGLGRIWPWLTLEEAYPIPIAPEHPGRINEALDQRWDGLSESEREREEELMFDFLHRHNLALLLRGISLPALFLLREGKEFVIWTVETGPIRARFEDVIRNLEQLGDCLADLVNDSTDSRAIQASKYWRERNHSHKAELQLQIRTGMNVSELRQLFADNLEHTDFVRNPYEDTEIYAAARMTAGHIEISAQAKIIDAIRGLPKTHTPTLDTLARQVPDATQYGKEGYEQGYGLAHWLRDQLALGDKPVDPDTLLLEWGVPVSVLDMDPKLSAVAVWGKQHGPAVIVNSQHGARSAFKHGRRTTVAHEICHLLYDRDRSLPVIDILGGLGPRFAEKRANAFAAEFLLPRSVASQQIGSESILEASKKLARVFQVSPEVVMRQIRNSDKGSLLTRQEILQLEAWVRKSAPLILQ